MDPLLRQSSALLAFLQDKPYHPATNSPVVANPESSADGTTEDSKAAMDKMMSSLSNAGHTSSVKITNLVATVKFAMSGNAKSDAVRKLE